MKKLLVCACLCAAFALYGCGTNPTPTAVKVGKPYTVDGRLYSPAYDPHYDKIGMASWYGPGFHGEKTANGERYDQEALTAASPTLPLPSIVKVTNLASGKSAVIRVNDRGPFKDNRLIDLSHASAQALGITGLQRVRVEYLKNETEAYWAKMRLKTDEVQFAQNDPYAPGKEVAAPQIKSAAPVTSVAAADLKPEDLKFKPIQPHFRVIAQAQAKEPDAAATPSPEAQDEPAPPPAGPVQPKVVKLVHIHDNPAAKKPPVPTKQEAEAMARKPVAAGTPGTWFIQAGSFVSEENAHKLAKKLQAYADVDVLPVQVGAQTWHRVRMGPFSNSAAAEQALDKAHAEGASGARMVGN